MHNDCQNEPNTPSNTPSKNQFKSKKFLVQNICENFPKKLKGLSRKEKKQKKNIFIK